MTSYLMIFKESKYRKVPITIQLQVNNYNYKTKGCKSIVLKLQDKS